MKKLLPLLILLFCTIGLHAQSSDVVTEIINSDKVTFGQVCYLSAVQQGFIEEDASYSDAINALYENGQIPKALYEDTVVPMVNLAFIYAQIWDIKGGLFYRLFRGAPRYAFKQMKADGIFDSSIDPDSIPSGRDALNLYTSCMLYYGKQELNVE